MLSGAGFSAVKALFVSKCGVWETHGEILIWKNNYGNIWSKPKQKNANNFFNELVITDLLKYLTFHQLNVVPPIKVMKS
jgi:hypothetical protein